MSSIELVKKDVVQYTALRVTLTSDQPFQETLAALAQELNQDKAGVSLINVLRTSSSKEEFDKGVGAITENGKHDFLCVNLISLHCRCRPLTDHVSAFMYAVWLGAYVSAGSSRGSLTTG